MPAATGTATVGAEVGNSRILFEVVNPSIGFVIAEAWRSELAEEISTHSAARRRSANIVPTRLAVLLMRIAMIMWLQFLGKSDIV